MQQRCEFYDSIQESKCPCVGNYSGVNNYSGGDRHCHSVEISFVQTCNCHLNQGKQYNLEVNDKECNTTPNSSNESIAKEQMDSAENVYQLFVAVVAFDRNRGAIALGGKYR